MRLIGQGHTAPDFTLTNYDGTLFTLSQQLTHGPVVLIFYIADELPNCDKLLCRINDDVREFADLGITVAGVNNLTPERHQQYAERRLMQLPLLSDTDCRVAEMYDSIFSIGPIRVIRYSVVGIGTNGVIRYHQRGRPSNQAIITGMRLGLPNSPSV